MKGDRPSSPQNGRWRQPLLSGDLGFWAGFAIIALVFAAGAALTWRKWPDLIVDFGLQLYIPWQLSGGAVLYRDLFYMAGGPLSQYWHALLFKLFGPSFLVIILSNLAITALMLFIACRSFSRAAGNLCGFVTTLAVVCVFCFGQFTGVGNYNYAAPYSHEMLHGLCLSIAALACLSAWRERRRGLPMATAGVCLGLVALTKPDIFVALAVAVLAAFGFSWKLGRSFLLRSVGALLAGTALSLLAFFLLFVATAGGRDALRLEFFGWRPVFISAVVSSPFYQWCLGLDDPFGHLRTIAFQTLILAAVVAVCAWSVRRVDPLPSRPRRFLIAAVALLLLAAAWRVPWADAGGALPVLCVGLLALLWRRRLDQPADETVFFPLLWTVFALFLLAKQGLFPRLWQTGFTLAMPAFVCAIFLLGWELPRFLQARFAVPALPLRGFTLLVLSVALASLVHNSLRHYQSKHLPVGRGTDVIIASGPMGNAVEARTMNQALGWIQTNLPPAASLAAIPQGCLLNYLSRHPNSAPCLDWNPAMLAVFGATNMQSALAAHPPDYIALVEWQAYEFNTTPFGSKNYAADTMAWISQHYTPAALFGSEPLRNGLFGIKILKRKDPLAGPVTQ